MSHHLFRDVVSFEAKSDNQFYASGYAAAISVNCHKTGRQTLVRNNKNEEVVSRDMYMFPSNINVRPEDKVDGNKVISTSPCRGISRSYIEVFI
jgi:hypothetical protein